MRFGRLLKRGDQLFAASCQASSGAVILQRHSTDDYVRMRVPDTDCPPLPEPGTPLDSGLADEAEPNRWQYGGEYVPSNGWLISGAPGSAIDWVQPSYTCYEGDFLTRVTVRPTGASRYPIYYITDHFGLFLPLSNGVVGIGFGGAVRPAEGNTFAVEMVLWHSSGGGAGYNRWVNLGTPVHLFIRRSRGTISVGWSVTNPNAPDANTEIEVAYGVFGQVQFRLAKDFYLPETQPPQPPTSRIAAIVSEWRTISGAPSEIWVQTPVLDLGRRRRIQGEGLPQGVQLLWRGSDQLPLPDSWNNSPEGRYRYWQVRLQSSDLNTLIERLEITPYDAPGDDPGDGGGGPGDGGGQPSVFRILLRRFRSYWQIFGVPPDRRTTGPFRTVFGSGGQQRTGENEWTQMNNEERNIGDGWK